MMAKREVQSRYRQALLGIFWVVARPVMLLVVFTYIFKGVANMNASLVPYPVMVFTGLLFFEYFSACTNRISNSFLSNRALIEKVKCPRLIMPISAIMVCLFDSMFIFATLLILMAMLDVGLSSNIIFLPILILATTSLAFGFGLFLATITVWFRDLAQIIAFLLQGLMWVTPIGYEFSSLPEGIANISYYNPLAILVEQYRWAIYASPSADFDFSFLLACIASFLILGLAVFFRFERNFADVI
tara:strand:- start:1050 stop:1781 length:732 start_codon:yes stop_codon:yes gene_type:complete